MSVDDGGIRAEVREEMSDMEEKLQKDQKEQLNWFTATFALTRYTYKFFTRNCLLNNLILSLKYHSKFFRDDHLVNAMN